MFHFHSAAQGFYGHQVRGISLWRIPEGFPVPILFALSYQLCVDELKLLRDIEKLLGLNIEKVELAGFDIDPMIKAEPIQNGRNGRGKSGGGQRNGRGRQRSHSGGGRPGNSNRSGVARAQGGGNR